MTDETATTQDRLWHRRGALGAIGAGAALIGGCVASPFGGGPGDGWGSRATAPDAPPPAAGGALSGDVIGGGGTRIGLILPLSATGNAGAVARSMRLAAELAYGDVAGNDLAVMVRDDRGTTEGAQAAATELVQAGAQLVLGPLISANVVAAAGVLRPANIPLIAFSTDEAVAAPGIHLLSFLPSNDVNRMVDYCASQGRRAFVALFPQDPYGQVVEGALMPALSRVGARAVAVERYPLDRVQMIEPVQRVIPALAQADVLFIADGADASALVLENLRGARGAMARVKIAGTGRWDDPRVLQNQAFAGAWYTGPDANGFRTFAQRYRQRFNADPRAPRRCPTTRRCSRRRCRPAVSRARASRRPCSPTPTVSPGSTACSASCPTGATSAASPSSRCATAPRSRSARRPPASQA